MDFIIQSPKIADNITICNDYICSLLASTVTAAATAGDYQAAVAASLPLVWKA